MSSATLPIPTIVTRSTLLRSTKSRSPSAPVVPLGYPLYHSTAARAGRMCPNVSSPGSPPRLRSRPAPYDSSTTSYSLRSVLSRTDALPHEGSS